jgi:hypothetical protein
MLPLSCPPCRLIWSEQQTKFAARRCLAIPLILLCSTDDPVTRGTWRRLGFGFTTPADLAGFGVGPRDLLHMDNTVQARDSRISYFPIHWESPRPGLLHKPAVLQAVELFISGRAVRTASLVFPLGSEACRGLKA